MNEITYTEKDIEVAKGLVLVTATITDEIMNWDTVQRTTDILDMFIVALKRVKNTREKAEVEDD